MLQAVAQPCASRQHAAFDIAPFGSRAIVVLCDREEHLAIRLGAVTLRIDVSGTICDGPAALRFTIAAGRGLPRQIAALRYFAALSRVRLPAPAGWHVMPETRLARLVAALRVLDALHAGASLRSIACTLFVGSGWPGPGESAKSRVRRLVDLAQRLERGKAAAVLAHGV